MGSIVGGCMQWDIQPDSIAVCSGQSDMDADLSDRIPENKIIFLEKKHFTTASSLSLSHGNEIILPSGLINGQQIENMA